MTIYANVPTTALQPGDTLRDVSDCVEQVVSVEQVDDSPNLRRVNITRDGVLTWFWSGRDALHAVERSDESDAVAGYMDTFGVTTDDYDHDAFLDSYQGRYDSERDFAESLADDLGLLDAEQTWPHTCIDWEHATRELMYDYASHPASCGGVHIYRSV